jgi:phospholipid/cholesterol/gamma-HCH transport system ATP-binding protein
MIDSSSPIIQVKNVTVRYDGRTILENVSFDINRGEIFMIVGGSGCGKSTMLRQIIGLETPAEGEILIDGIDITKATGESKKEVLIKFGVLFQSSGLFASMTLAENIALLLETYTDISKQRMAELIDIKLAAVGLRGFDSFLPSEISGGMKKRAALARAMALDPKILCFDEPSSGLDPVTAASMDALIREINSALGTTMVVVSHDLDGVLTTAQKVIMLDKSVKGIIAQGHPLELKEMKDNPIVYNFFNRISE